MYRRQHFRRFEELTFQQGFTPYETKMKIGIIDVNFLGLKIKLGKIVPQDRIAEKAKKFFMN